MKTWQGQIQAEVINTASMQSFVIMNTFNNLQTDFEWRKRIFVKLTFPFKLVFLQESNLA